MAEPPIRITGGAGPEVAAAIAAVVNRLLAEEWAAAASPPKRFMPGPWALSSRPRPIVGPGQTMMPVPKEWLGRDQAEDERD